MSTIEDLEAKKAELNGDLAFSKRHTDAIMRTRENVNGVNCAEIIEKCKKRKQISSKYRKKHIEKRREIRGKIKEINAEIKSIKQSQKRHRCPNGYRKNRKTSKCVKK